MVKDHKYTVYDGEKGLQPMLRTGTEVGPVEHPPTSSQPREYNMCVRYIRVGRRGG